MKITPDHYAHMKSAIAAIAPRLPEIKARIAADPHVKDSAKRLRWDCAHQAGLPRFFCDCIYPYAHDEHIDTALRAIMKGIDS